MNNLNVAVIGNCQIAALIGDDAGIVWYCVPRLDGDPVFSALLSGEDRPETGIFTVEIQDRASGEQRYLRNSAIVETVLRDSHGGALKVTDFAPRFVHFGRKFRPVAIMRIIEPVVKGRFEASGFAKRYTEKGRFSGYLERIPVYMVLAPTPALRGITRHPRVRQDHKTQSRRQ